MDIAKHIRIYEFNPSDEFTTKRTTAIKGIRTAFGKITTAGELLRLASNLAQAGFSGGAFDDNIRSQIFGALKKQSPSLVADDCATEMGVCALLAAGELIAQAGNSTEVSTVDLLALGLWLAIDLLPPPEEPKINQLRDELLALVRARVISAARTSRERSAVPNVTLSGDTTVTSDAAAQAIAPVIEALRANAALDREELDLLWWLYADRSELLDVRLSSLNPIVRAATVGIEIGAMMRRVPSQAYRNLALKDVDASTELTLTELLTALGDHGEALAMSFANFTSAGDAPAVFPVLLSVREGSARAGVDSRARSLSDWTARVLLERTALQIQLTNARRK